MRQALQVYAVALFGTASMSTDMARLPLSSELSKINYIRMVSWSWCASDGAWVT